MSTPARISHSVLDPYFTIPLRRFYPTLHLPTTLPPEAIVLSGHVCAVAAALALAMTPTLPWLGVLAAGLIVAHHLCDVFDGTHARATGQCRHGGELLDHFLDLLSMSYLIVGWAWAAGMIGWAIPGILIVMATGVLTNLKAKLGAAFELPQLGPTELKTFLVVLALLTSFGSTIDVSLTIQFLRWTLFAVTILAAIRLPFEVFAAVRAVNQSVQAVDTTEWQAGD